MRLCEKPPSTSQRRPHTTALDQDALLELTEVLRTADGGVLMRTLLRTMLQSLVDAEATAHIGAAPHERTETRTTQRNGGRDKLVATAAGDLTIRVPKVRAGSFFPSLLAPRRRIDVALHAVVMQAYVEGVSTRKVDDLVHALGVESGISKSEVSRICAGLDSEVASDVGDSEDEVFWTAFLRSLRDRGLGGVQLLISDAHAGLQKAIVKALSGASWQRSSADISTRREVPVGHLRRRERTLAA